MPAKKRKIEARPKSKAAGSKLSESDKKPTESGVVKEEKKAPVCGNCGKAADRDAVKCDTTGCRAVLCEKCHDNLVFACNRCEKNYPVPPLIPRSQSYPGESSERSLPC
jgi:hypothetical protein